MSGGPYRLPVPSRIGSGFRRVWSRTSHGGGCGGFLRAARCRVDRRRFDGLIVCAAWGRRSRGPLVRWSLFRHIFLVREVDHLGVKSRVCAFFPRLLVPVWHSHRAVLFIYLFKSHRAVRCRYQTPTLLHTEYAICGAPVNSVNPPPTAQLGRILTQWCLPSLGHLQEDRLSVSFGVGMTSRIKETYSVRIWSHTRLLPVTVGRAAHRRTGRIPHGIFHPSSNNVRQLGRTRSCSVSYHTRENRDACASRKAREIREMFLDVWSGIEGRVGMALFLLMKKCAVACNNIGDLSAPFANDR